MENREVKTVAIYYPGQDAVVPLFKVPADHVYTVEAAYATDDRATAADAANYWTLKLLNGDTDQSGTDAISDEIGGAAGWEANTPVAFTITSGSGDLSAGQWLMAKFDETIDGIGGAVAPGLIVVTIEYVDGIGSKA